MIIKYTYILGIAIYVIATVIMLCSKLLTTKKEKKLEPEYEARRIKLDKLNHTFKTLTKDDMDNLNLRLTNDGSAYGICISALLAGIVTYFAGAAFEDGHILSKILYFVMSAVYVVIYVFLYQQKKKKFYNVTEDLKCTMALVVDKKEVALSANAMRSGSAFYIMIIAYDETGTLKQFSAQVTASIYYKLNKNPFIRAVFYKNKFVNVLA